MGDGDADAEALRQMQAASSAPDRRGDGDAAWLANGAQVELHSLQKAAVLNGQRGEIVGFDDKQPLVAAVAMSHTSRGIPDTSYVISRAIGSIYVHRTSQIIQHT